MAKRDYSNWTGCPIRYFSGRLGDRWSLIVLRGALFSGHRRYNAFLKDPEGIATNILADRLAALTAAGLLEKSDAGQGPVYTPTLAALDLLPVLVAVILWAGEEDASTLLPAGLIQLYRRDPGAAVARLRMIILARDWAYLDRAIARTQTAMKEAPALPSRAA